jgi:hypothetical protein
MHQENERLYSQSFSISKSLIPWSTSRHRLHPIYGVYVVREQVQGRSRNYGATDAGQCVFWMIGQTSSKDFGKNAVARYSSCRLDVAGGVGTKAADDVDLGDPTLVLNSAACRQLSPLARSSGPETILTTSPQHR